MKKPPRITLLNAERYHCRWIDGAPKADAALCGEQTADGSYYCATHLKRCWDRAGSARSREKYELAATV